jgi:hypothetical protein
MNTASSPTLPAPGVGDEAGSCGRRPVSSEGVGKKVVMQVSKWSRVVAIDDRFLRQT